MIDPESHKDICRILLFCPVFQPQAKVLVTTINKNSVIHSLRRAHQLVVPLLVAEHARYPKSLHKGLNHEHVMGKGVWVNTRNG
jgi:hypothetical protein